MKETTVRELKAMLDSGEDIQLIDVRELNEYEFCNIGAELIPMGEIIQKSDQLSRDKKVIIHCKSGGRSGNVVNALTARGFDNVSNLVGGILAWSDEIDPSIPKY
ncbi:rhodanese-like domain-containing protein [Salibacteraceae bacterium]|jgi:sulfur-carrier protein adenylyltransferase/sulfurtransferase|nr:rhodanese-like domain-containing protein [Salibacteraceae bacterium]MDB4104720.1 rhodanese-like domain-containing protein [Salibacteraceae bacterium]MDB9710186.1 rhodanese-like domain-containing protein [Salibacteraceae bacterium]MDC1304224.1 rhodanese-like domain-containing protein [Salibacteraceae bacterium]HAQ69503.1 NADH oxidase [Flavobacteriales bacterium]